MASVINKDGYRLNVGIMIINNNKQLLLARRNERYCWQYPQGGIAENETEEQALYRELKEEVGLDKSQVSLITKSKHWYSYKIPPHCIRRNSHPVCIGQTQRWFLLHLLCDDSHINLNNCPNPELSHWNWFRAEDTICEAIHFKRQIYESVINEFQHHIC